jgi:hypothetical protein
MTDIVVAVGLAALVIFGSGLLVGMAVGAVILRRADRVSPDRDRVGRAARRLIGFPASR